ncbi:MAG: dTDP-glucose 4,6-dehydratase [Planctomycetota bacterium]
MFEGQTLFVTGGAGFIGNTLVRRLLQRTAARVVTLDALTYAGNVLSLGDAIGDPRHTFVQGDIADAATVAELIRQHSPRAVLNLAAESHVDRSIDGPSQFVQTNLVGTATLLDAAYVYWRGLSEADANAFRFLQASTDEVFGSLAADEPPSTEASPYTPNSPYAATKAGADHLVRAYRQTYGLPTIITRSTNNYGPRQHPEKLIPLMAMRALAGEPLPIYGDGLQVRDWLHVDDQCEALITVLDRGALGETYNLGADDPRTNLQVVHAICDAVDTHAGRPAGETATLITHVEDRPGHDRRYALNSEKANGLEWRPQTSFSAGVEATVAWYATNRKWVEAAADGNPKKRIGLRPRG